MIPITIQAPLPTAPARAERPTPSAHALPAVATVASASAMNLQSAAQDRPAFRTPSDTYADRSPDDGDKAAAPQPFPALRFADPLPNLPELDLPTKAAAYQAALTVLRTDESAA